MFYLKHATVDEANTLLRQLLVQELAVGHSGLTLARLSLPQDVIDVAGSIDNLWNYETATVIPDERLNRFFVYGTQEDLAVIEQHLQVIDRENSIAQMNVHGTPRMIRLYHAKAEAVAEVIRDAYSGRIAATAKERSAVAAEAARNRNQQRPADQEQRPAEAGDQRAPPAPASSGDEAKMTLAVDAQSNSLVVTAPSQLADEVENLAKALDDEGRQTVQVLSLNGARATRIQQSLERMFGDQIQMGNNAQ